MRYFLEGAYIILPMATTALVVLVVLMYFVVHLTDPGIVPRRVFLLEDDLIEREDTNKRYLLNHDYQLSEVINADLDKQNTQEN